MSRSDIVIAGAGCAGLSLAVHLVEAGVDDRRIVLVEPRTVYRDDRTWCYWRMDSHPFERCVAHSWPRWRLAAGGRKVVRGSARHPYDQIPSGRFYRFALDRLEAASNVELLSGTRVLGVAERGDRVEVATSRGSIRAGLVFDGRPVGPPADGGELTQHFLGREVEVDRPVFDPREATLMDFGDATPDPRDGGEASAIHFLYLLPTGRRRALVESTWFSRRPFAAGVYRAAIDAYLERRFGVATREVIREERGILSMSRRPAVRAQSKLIIPIGAAGGAVRPSTGYAFLAIQRFSAEMARRVAGGAIPAAPAFYRRRSTLLDRIFLTALRRRPAAAPRLFLDLFDRTPPGALARFLSDRASLADDLRVVAALPKLPLSAAAVAELVPGLEAA